MFVDIVYTNPKTGNKAFIILNGVRYIFYIAKWLYNVSDWWDDSTQLDCILGGIVVNIQNTCC